MKKIYLDYSASTPVSAEVLRIMNEKQKNVFGNPGSLHMFGQIALKELDIARQNIAEAIGADFREIIFTGSATEANNLVLRGVVRNYKKIAGIGKKHTKPKIIISAIEHESVMQTARDLEKDGSVELAILPVNKQGSVSLKKLEYLLDEKTVLVSVMYGNNVIGSIEPIQKISRIVRNFRGSKSIYPLFHTDAVQTFQYLDCNVGKLGVDFMTISSHKIYGPKGIGALFMKRNPDQQPTMSNLMPITTGGGQEFGLRSGTENIPLIAGFSEAVLQTAKLREHEFVKMAKLKSFFISLIKKELSDVKTNSGEGNFFLPNIVNLYFPKISAEKLLIALDMRGVAISSGSACSVRSNKNSYVFKALLKENYEKNSIRISMGRPTTKADLLCFISALKEILRT